MLEYSSRRDHHVIFVRDGLVVFTERAVAVLAKAGLSREVIDRARGGMALTEHTRLADLGDALLTLLMRIDPTATTAC